ncbi:MAG TPA: hypothetical protein VM658_07045 [bacterium]|nr:hypothetical protein [bacterium]
MVNQKSYRTAYRGKMVRGDIAAMLDSEGNPNIVKSFLSMPQDILEGMVDRGESVDSIFTTSYMLESGLESAERLRLRIKDKEEGTMAKEKVDMEELEDPTVNPFISTSDDELRAAAELKRIRDGQIKVDPVKTPDPGPDLTLPENNPFIPN